MVEVGRILFRPQPSTHGADIETEEGWDWKPLSALSIALASLAKSAKVQRNEGKAIAFNRRFGRRLPKDIRKRKIIGGEMREGAVIGAKTMDSVDSYYCTKVPVTKEEAHVGTFLFFQHHMSL